MLCGVPRARAGTPRARAGRGEMGRRMSESKQRRRRHQHILEDSTCIYCGGVSPATTVEHMPPRVIFWRRDRPKGLEFPSCEQCNNGTRLSDQVAGLMSRIYPNSTNSEHGEEFRRLLRAIRNNCPGLLEEMEIGPGGQNLLRKRAPADVEGGFLRIGPLVHSHMQVFAVTSRCGSRRQSVPCH